MRVTFSVERKCPLIHKVYPSMEVIKSISATLFSILHSSMRWKRNNLMLHWVNKIGNQEPSSFSWGIFMMSLHQRGTYLLSRNSKVIAMLSLIKILDWKKSQYPHIRWKLILHVFCSLILPKSWILTFLFNTKLHQK